MQLIHLSPASFDLQKLLEYLETLLYDVKLSSSMSNNVFLHHLTIKEELWKQTSLISFIEKIIPFIENADLLYHEATFLDSEKLLAKKTFHCTTLQAADIANRSKAKQLMIGHYSARYNDLDVLLEETKTSFQNTVLALEGKTYELG